MHPRSPGRHAALGLKANWQSGTNFELWVEIFCVLSADMFLFEDSIPRLQGKTRAERQITIPKVIFFKYMFLKFFGV